MTTTELADDLVGPLRLIVTYTPGCEEKALEAAPDYHLHDAGTVPTWAQT
jgi:hypothetical protein